MNGIFAGEGERLIFQNRLDFSHPVLRAFLEDLINFRRGRDVAIDENHVVQLGFIVPAELIHIRLQEKSMIEIKEIQKLGQHPLRIIIIEVVTRIVLILHGLRHCHGHLSIIRSGLRSQGRKPE